MAPFSYKNYFTPSPPNLERWVEGLHGLLILIVGTSWFAGVTNENVLLIVTLSGYGLDKLSRFFARAAKDYAAAEIPK